MEELKEGADTSLRFGAANQVTLAERWPSYRQVSRPERGDEMKPSLALAGLFALSGLDSCHAALAQAQDQSQPLDVMRAPASGSQDAPLQRHGDREGRGRPVFGKISALSSDSIEVTAPDGNKVTLKLTSSTEFRKDRQPAKVTDFKVGDVVVVRTDQADGKGSTALMVLTGQFGMRNGQGGAGGFGAMSGTLGKDFVIGEVKAVDPPRLTVMRTDNVAQTLELNEDTSLRRGRESVTMADIQAGDHIIAHGAVENNVFVPKNLNVISPEQWKRLQEMLAGGGSGTPLPANAPASPKSPPVPNAPSKPPEPQT
jgi:hypothetical protein